MVAETFRAEKPVSLLSLGTTDSTFPIDITSTYQIVGTVLSFHSKYYMPHVLHYTTALDIQQIRFHQPVSPSNIVCFWPCNYSVPRDCKLRTTSNSKRLRYALVRKQPGPHLTHQRFSFCERVICWTGRIPKWL